jgi:hypothetical protein
LSQGLAAPPILPILPALYRALAANMAIAWLRVASIPAPLYFNVKTKGRVLEEIAR